MHQTQEENRTASIEVRIAPDALAVVKRAAEIQGRSVNDFVVAAAQEAAHRTIEETQIIRLSLEDQRAFAEAIINPPAPAPAFRRSLLRYRDQVFDNARAAKCLTATADSPDRDPETV